MDTPLPSRHLADRNSARRYLPRFSLRALLILGFVCCLLFGWIGRNLYRVRREQVAVEALQQAGGSYQFARDEGASENRAFDEYSPILRLLGVTPRPALSSVSLSIPNTRDPKADAALQALAVFPEVKTVRLSGPAFDDSSIARLAELRQLETITLNDTKVAGDNIARLSSTKIRILRWTGGDSLPFGKSRLNRDDDDASELSKLEGLESLRISSITDVGLDRLVSLPKLRRLEIYSPVTADAARKFSASHPTCSVTHHERQPYFLRVTTYLAGEVVSQEDPY